MSDNDYFNWLYEIVAPSSNPNPSRSYYQLLEQMHIETFTWFVPNDDNRVEDGKELRYEFMNGPDMGGGCSFLEMLIALSRRASFQSSGYLDEWFWHLAENLDLRQYNDENFTSLSQSEVRHILRKVIDRTYDYDGLGGLFPLHNPKHDQREVELWYQMSSYLLEGRGP